MGLFGYYCFGASPIVVTSLAVVGTGVLLWATLAMKGWDIQTIDGVTLTERVNSWIFRILYWLGTALLVAAAAWDMVS